MSLRGSGKSGIAASLVCEPAAQRYEVAEIVIGKDVLELVSSAMYVDPMTVYREYIQNAADAVDAARDVGALKAEEVGRVQIFIDAATRSVRIRDNGCGVPFPEFGRKLTAVGGSEKRGTSARGFRGVGRLAGLGYAQELMFRSRVEGEAEVSQLSWDCRQLRAALRAASDKNGAAELIRNVTRLERVKVHDVPDRFFEVEMRGIIRTRNDRLMSPSVISDYLSQVGPVPFSPQFSLGPELSEVLSRYIDLGELDIRINDADKPIHRPHRDQFSFDDRQGITFQNLCFIEIPSIHGNLAAIAWLLHHDYEAAVPPSTLVKGLRLRTGNMQVGDNVVLQDLFPEPRFNGWSVGEVHVTDPRVVPNGRRDQFEQNIHFSNLTNHLSPMARDLTRRCRASSVRRRWEREFELHAQSVGETIGILVQSSASRLQRDKFALSAEQTLLRMNKIAHMDVLADCASDYAGRIGALREALGQAMNDEVLVSSPLMRLPKSQQKMYEGFFDLVYQCSVNRAAAKALIDRILLKID